MGRIDVLPVASECGLVLFACSASLGIAQVHRLGASRGLDYLVATGVPASAALAFLFVALIAPGFLSQRSVRFPVNITAPMVYTALLVVASIFWSSNGSSIKALPEAMRPVEVWSRPLVIALAAVAQVLALSIVAAFAREDRQSVR